MRHLLILLLLLVMTTWATPVSDHGALSVQNGVIVDKNGKPPQLRGMSLFWNIYPEGSKYYNATTVQQLASSWKIDVLRVAIGNTSAQDAKTMIDAAIANGIYVIVDWHYHDAQNGSAKAFFTDVSNYVKGKNNPPNVIYEIWNEPTTKLWNDIYNYAVDVIPSIRGNSPNSLIIIGTPSYSSLVDAALAKPVPGTNLAYAFHFYASEAAHYNYRNRMLNAICNKLPIFATEWGTSVADGGANDKTLDWPKIYNWVSLMETFKVSWANWSIADKPESSAALNGGTQPSQVGNAGNLSPSGTYLRNVISALNTTGTHSSVSSDSYKCPSSSSFSRTGKGTLGFTLSWEAENYRDSSGVNSMAVTGAMNGQVMTGYNTPGEYTDYLVTSNQARDTILMMVLNTRGGAGVFKYTIGGKTLTANIPQKASWGDTYVPIQIPPGENALKIEVQSVSNAIDFDYFSFVIPDSIDTATYKLDTWLSNPSAIQEHSIATKLNWNSRSSTLSWDKPLGWTQLEILDSRGRRVYTTAIAKDQNSIQLDQQGLPSGILHARLTGENVYPAQYRFVHLQ